MDVTVWMLVMATTAIFTATLRILTEAMRGSLLVGGKRSGLAKKRQACLNEAEKARQRIDDLNESIEHRKRDIRDLTTEVELARTEFTQLEARVSSRNPTRHKVPTVS